MDIDVYYNLKEKARLVEWNNNLRNEKYILFSISGYTEKLKKLASDREDIIFAEELI